MPKPKTGAERQASLRDKGRQVSVVLRDPAAISALELLVSRLGGITAAVSFALVESTSKMVQKRK